MRAQPATDTTRSSTASSHTGSAAWRPWLLGTQINVITQHLLPSSAPHLGPNTLPTRAETETSQAYGVYGGVEVNARLQGYLDVEMIRGQGINRATGVSGAHWGRDADRFGAAVLQHGIVAVHRQYLAAGGVGFLLGDGRLTYGDERIVESYYRLQVGEYVHIGPDAQVIMNPGYNRDRGTVTLLAARCNLRY